MTENTTNNNEIIDLKELLFKYLRKWHWFAISVSACICLAFFYLQTQNAEFEINSTIMLRSDENSSAMPQSEMLEKLGMLSNSKDTEDELHIINSANLMHQVITNLNLQTRYTKKVGLRYTEEYPIPSYEIKYPNQFTDTLKKSLNVELEKRETDYKITLEYGSGRSGIDETYFIKDINKPINTIIGQISFAQNKEVLVDDEFRMSISPMVILVGSYRKILSATQVKKESNVVKFSTISATPSKAIDMINELVRLYNLDAVIDKNIMASNTAQFIEERLKIITEELTEVELDVESYMTRNKLANIEAETELFLETSSEYQKKIAEIETQLNLISYIQTHVQDPRNKNNLIPANLGIEDPSLVLLIQEYNKSLLERLKLLRTTNPQNPVIQQLESQLQIVRENIVTSINSLKDGINISKDDIMSKDKQFEMRIQSVPTQARQYIEIKRQQLIKETLYTYLYQKREENAVTLASTVQPAKTIDTAGFYPEPVAPRTMIILLIAMILGGCIPIVLLFIRDFIYDKVEDAREYEKLVKVPSLGHVCVSDNPEERVAVKDGVTSPIAELFRLIRTNLNFALNQAKSPVILVTSTISGEGKSFIAMNVALSYALLKKKVVLVGLDIRNPQLTNYMHLAHKGYLTPYLSDVSYDAQDIIMPSKINDYLDVVPAGPIPPNPGELLLSERLDELITYLKQQYDYIIIDSAPIGMVSDTFLFKRFTDITLYISRVGHTPKDSAEFINHTYTTEKLKNMYCILNGTKEDTGTKGTYGYYSYGKGYGYSKKKKK